MKKRKLYFCIGRLSWKDEKGKEHTTTEKYVGTINALNKETYFEGAWFDEYNKCAGTIVITKDDFKKEIVSCKELKDE